MKLPSPKILSLVFRIVLGLVILMIGSGVFQALKASAPELETANPEDRSIRVQVITAQAVPLPRQWRGYGTTMAKDTADIPARVGTTVKDIPDDIEVGRVVAINQIIAELDATDFEREVETATAQLAEIDAAVAQLAVEEARLAERLELEREDIRIAQEEYDRQRGYFENGRSSQQDLDRAQRTLIAAQRAVVATGQAIDAIEPRGAALTAQRTGVDTRLKTARENVTRCTIRSPMDGVIEAIDIEEGENLAPGQRVARVVDPRLIEVPVQMPASARGDVEVGNTVTITTRNLPYDCPPWEATVARIGVSNDPQTRTFTAYALLDQTGTSLSDVAAGGGAQRMPVGAFVASTLVSNDVQPRWVVPARAIREGRIRLVVNDKITSQPVRTAYEYEGEIPAFGLPDTQWVVLDSPLEPGAQIVINASVSVLDGQHVKPIAQTPAQPASNTDDNTRDQPGANP